MVSARREGDTVIVFIPGWMSDSEERRWVDEMVRRLERSEERKRSPGRTGDEALKRRSLELSRRYLEGRAVPSTVRWVRPMRTRWASCTPADGTIRISERLRDTPAWVVDYVLVHELAHLLEPGHDEPFWAWVHRYPRAERAMGYLEGLSAAAGLGLIGIDGPDEAGADPLDTDDPLEAEPA
jgi:predicted metal-dependent hydrolase